jgi:hypothetical protein
VHQPPGERSECPQLPPGSVPAHKKSIKFEFHISLGIMTTIRASSIPALENLYITQASFTPCVEAAVVHRKHYCGPSGFLPPMLLCYSWEDSLSFDLVLLF